MKNIKELLDPALWQTVSTLVHKAHEEGARALLVGGCVRDALMGQKAVDIDIEMYGMAAGQLEAWLSKHFSVDKVGKAFGIYKIRTCCVDVSLPRKESKTGTGHKGFDVSPDPYLSFEEATSRRDFTINSMLLDPLTGELIDLHGGQKDLEAKILRHTSQAFSEDPLRVLRAMQFVARFELRVAPQTLKLCASIEPEGLPRERIFAEWEKLLCKGIKPSMGLSFLRDCNWVGYYPELQALIGCKQDPLWHPEGDVWTHTLHALDAFARERTGVPWEDLVVGLAVLCHDMGKPLTTFTDKNGRIRSPMHEKEGEEPTRTFLERITEHKDLIASVMPLVLTHMRPRALYKSAAKDASIRRLSLLVGRIDRLVRVIRADAQGIPPFELDSDPVGDWLLNEAEKLKVRDQRPEPIILGRHIIALGLQPGPHFKKILDSCFEAQLEGIFSDEAAGVEYLKGIIDNQ